MSRLEIIRPARVTPWHRFTTSLRSLRLGPWSSRDPELAKYFGGSAVSSGVAVNEDTALNYAAVWNAVNLISSDIAKLPLPLYKRVGEGTVQGKERYATHALYRLIHDEPNNEMSSFVFRRTLQAHTLVWGNSYAEIERDQADRPVALWPLLPNTVQSYRESKTGPLRYRVWNPSGGSPIEFAGRDILHLSGLGSDGISGYTLVGRARESLGLGIATERFGATFFGNGSTFGGIISYPPGVTTNQQTRDDNRKALAERHQGVDRAHRLLALYEGAKYEQMGVPPEAAQFLETRKFQVAEVARWFNLPVHKLKDLERSTNNNIEHQALEYVTDTLVPWLVLWEQELNRKLISKLERNIQFFEHITEGLLRGDAAGRGEFYSKLFSIGAITQNEIRSRENLNPIDGGNTPFVPVNMIPSNKLDEYIDAQIKAKQPAAPPPSIPDADGDDDRSQQVLTKLEEIQQQQAAEIVRLSTTHAAIETRLDTSMRELDSVRAELQTERTVSADLRTALSEGRQAESVLRTQLSGATEQMADLQTRVAEADRAANAERERGAHAVSELLERERSVTAERDEALRQVQTLTEERDAAVSAAQLESEARRTELARAQEAADDARAREQQAAANLQAVTVERDALRGTSAVQEGTITELRESLTDVRDSQQVRRAVLIAAMRGLVVDTVERLLLREIDRARKNQQTQERFKKWMDQFYPLHQEFCRSALRPAVLAWAAVAECDPEALLERMVTGHIETSTAALRQVVDQHDADDFAAQLERTVRRWETERAGAVADALVKEGMAAHG